MAASRPPRRGLGARSRRPLVAVDVSVLPVRPSRLMLRTRLWRRHRRSHRPAPLGAARPGLVRTQRSAQHVPFPRARTGAAPPPAPLGAGRGPDRRAPDLADARSRRPDPGPRTRILPAARRGAGMHGDVPAARIGRPAAARRSLAARTTGTPAEDGTPALRPDAAEALPGPAIAARRPLVSPTRPGTVARLRAATTPGVPTTAPRAPATAARRPATTPRVPTPGARPPATTPRIPTTANQPPAATPGVPATAAGAAAAWLAQVRARPLENPQPLPSAWRPLARRLAGSPAIRYTTGASTRAALAATGALGATTGSVLHLARQPQPADLPVLAHELGHARSPVARPRFLLSGAAGDLDAEERAVRRSTVAAPVAAAGVAVARLPVGGAATVINRQVPAPPADGSGPAGTAAARLPGGGAGAVLAREPSAPASSSSATTAPAGASGSATSPAVAPAPADGTPGAGAAIDYDKVVDHLESWLLRELERRGGRFGGVF